MKKVLILAIVFIMTNMIAQNYCTAQSTTLKRAPNASSAIIGNSIKYKNLEIAQFNFPKEMTWDDANKACTQLGDGWRLPTIEELKIIYKIKDNSANFSQRCYVFVSGTDVYIAGTVQYGNTIRGNGEVANDMEHSAVLWKNDKKIILAKCQSCEATSIAVSGMDVYVGGAVGPTGVIWKRDSAIIAESDKATLIDVTGETTSTKTSVNIGVALDSTMLLSKSKDKFNVDIEYIYDICVSGSDIYAIGQDDKNNMFVFKNGISIDKKYGNQFSCIYVSNKDVYVGGDNRGQTSSSASIWKNGNIINLGKNYINSSINKIFVKGNDVYCVGNGKKSENGNYIGILWKNGIVLN